MTDHRSLIVTDAEYRADRLRLVVWGIFSATILALGVAADLLGWFAA